MKLHSRIVLVGGLLAASLSAQAAGVVDVKFTQPANYIDAGRSPAEIDRTVSALDTHFKHYAAALPAGQTLHIEVLDVDLAGTVITRPVADVRLVQGRADLPHITLRYTLEADGRTLQSGEEMV